MLFIQTRGSEFASKELAQYNTSAIIVSGIVFFFCHSAYPQAVRLSVYAQQLDEGQPRLPCTIKFTLTALYETRTSLDNNKFMHTYHIRKVTTATAASTLPSTATLYHSGLLCIFVEKLPNTLSRIHIFLLIVPSGPGAKTCYVSGYPRPPVQGACL